MTFAQEPSARRPVLERRRRGPLLPTIVVLVVLFIALSAAAEIWTEVLWYRQVGFGGVYRTRLVTQIVLFVLGAVVMTAAVFASLALAYRSRPVYAPVSPEQQNLDRYRESLEPLRRVVMIALPAALGLFAGSAVSGQWQTVQLWLNRVPFGEVDPHFGIDVGFWVFTLPFLRFLIGFATAVIVLAALGGAAVHYLYGGIRLQGEGPRTTPAARIHLSVLAGLAVVMQGGAYWLDRYALLNEDSQLSSGASFTGATYSDINAVLPAKTILAVVAVVVALLFVVTAIRGSWRIPALGVGLLIVAAIVIGGIYPLIVQRFQVSPNEQDLEADYIQNNIDATLAAFALEDVDVQLYTAQTNAEAGALREDARTAASIRLLDPGLVSPAYRQLQQIRPYYAFPDTLDVDRYTIDGAPRDAVVAVRELDLDGLGSRSWVNDHTVYTHGFGVVAAYGNQRQDDGRPLFFQQGIPSTGELEIGEPRVYFGELSPNFSIVGGAEGSTPQELDFPDDDSPNGQRNTTYEGDGGPGIGGFFNQLLYAIKFQDYNILLTDQVNSQSQILYDRHPRDRVEKVAPFLTLDGNVYPAVVDGRIKWIVDGYTTTDQYPYSDRQVLESATQDSTTEQSAAVMALAQDEVNYMRNSVKATVDAFDGTVQLYAWEEDDPLLQAWEGVFPGAVTPMSEISGDLMSHLRYPEDLFKVQRTLLTRYHVTDPEAFYTTQDFWRTPQDPTTSAENPADQPPYYLTLQMPGQEQPSFSLTSTFIPQATGENVRNVLTGYLAVDAEPGDQAGQRREGYGQMRLLQLPRDSTVNGPGQVQNEFNANPTVSQALNVLRIGDSEVINGNLLTLPVGEGLLYVQPVYVQSSGETSYPLLQQVLVSFGDQIGFAETLDEALDQVFEGDSGVTTGDAGAGGGGGGGTTAGGGDTGGPTSGDTGGDTGGGTGGGQAPADAQQRLDEALVRANQAIQDGQAALADSDFGTYGEAQDRLNQAIVDALQAQSDITGEPIGGAQPSDAPTDQSTEAP